MIGVSQIEATLERVLSFPSPQPDRDAVRAFIADVVRPLLREAAFDQIALDDAGNLIAARRGRETSLLPLVWYTYGATYPAAGMRDPYPARRVEGESGIRWRGRGAAEQRTGLAAILEALRALGERERPERGYMLITSIAGEMGNHLVAEAIVREHRLQAAGVVLAIATAGRIGLGNLGRVDIHVEVEGVPCHSSDPSKGVNAVEGAVEFCKRLQALPPLPSDPELGRATLAITGIASEPLAPHTIPARCRITLDRRLLPGESPEEATAQVAACAEGIGPQRVRVLPGHFNLPGRIAADHPLPLLARQAAVETGQEAPYFYRRAALDAGYFIKEGMPAIMWGPGEPALAHTDEESVLLSDAVAGAEAYCRLTVLACWERPGALETK